MTNSPRQPHPMSVTSNNKEGDEHCVCANGNDPHFWDFTGPDKSVPPEMTHLFGIS
jgi:hypothetical protein